MLTTFLVAVACVAQPALGGPGGMGGGPVCSCTNATSTYGQCVASTTPFVFMTAPMFDTTCEDNCFQMNAPTCVAPLAAIRSQKQACLAQISTFRGCVQIL
jgi:hypothetical protein